jgi:hypothetical protein
MSRYFFYYAAGAVADNVCSGFYSYRFHSNYKEKLPDNYLSQAAKFAAQDSLIWPVTCALTFSRFTTLATRKIINPELQIAVEFCKHQCPPLPPSIPRLAAYNKKVGNY